MAGFAEHLREAHGGVDIVFPDAAARVLARDRRAADLASETLVGAVCPGPIDTGASRPWFTDMSGAQSAERAAEALPESALTPVRPEAYGEPAPFGKVRPWR